MFSVWLIGAACRLDIVAGRTRCTADGEDEGVKVGLKLLPNDCIIGAIATVGAVGTAGTGRIDIGAESWPLAGAENCLAASAVWPSQLLCRWTGLEPREAAP